MSKPWALLFTAVTVAGCAVPREAGFPDVARAVEQRTGHVVVWRQDADADVALRASVRALLAAPLTPAGAVQIALLHNPALQGTYEDLMIAQADLVQAGLLRNPTFSGKLGFPIPGASGPLSYGFGVELDFLDLLLIPARTRVAAADFEAVKRKVGFEVMELAHQVRVAYYTLLGAQQIAAMRREVLASVEASVEIARRQHEAGNISDLDLATEEGQGAEVQLDTARSEADIEGARERLTRLMGLWGPDARFTIEPALAELPTADPRLSGLESLAVAQRFDVEAARKEAEARAAELAMAKNYRFVGGATVGAALDHDPEGHTTAGPTASIELPIFDAKQAAVARLEARLRQAERRLDARSIDARSEVREAWNRLGFARKVAARYRTTVIPLRERIVALSQRHYDAMLLGVYQLLLAKQAEVNAYREYIEAVRDYWIARADLERAVGGRLAPLDLPPDGALSPPPTPTGHHHHP